MPRRRFGDRPLTREPLDVYKQTEKKRTEFLLKGAVSEAVSRGVSQATAAIGALPPIPGHPGTGNSGGPLAGGLRKARAFADAVTPEFAEDAAKKAGKGTLTALQAGQEYVGKPIFGVTSGRLGAKQQQYTDAQGRTVTYRRGSPSWTDLGRGVKELLSQSPAETYRESRQAYDEGQRDPELPAWKRIATDYLSDPAAYVGPGAVKGALAKAPAAVQASRGSKILGAILEQPGRAAVGGAVGAAAGGEVANRAGHPELEGLAATVGGLAGGIAAAPSVGRAGVRAIDATTALEERAMARAGIAGSPELGELDTSRFPRKKKPSETEGVAQTFTMYRGVTKPGKGTTEGNITSAQDPMDFFLKMRGEAPQEGPPLEEFHYFSPDRDYAQSYANQDERELRRMRLEANGSNIRRMSRGLEPLDENEEALRSFEILYGRPPGLGELQTYQVTANKVLDLTDYPSNPSVDRVGDWLESKGFTRAESDDIVENISFKDANAEFPAFAMFKNMPVSARRGSYLGDSGSRMRKLMEKHGYDAAMINSEGGNPEFIVLNRSQFEAPPANKYRMLAPETVPHEGVTERPDLFQGRDADPGRSFGEAKVRNIVENFDPARLEPGLLVRDTNTGQMVVVRGHHRLEAMRRMADRGDFPGEAQWQVVEADLGDPQQVDALKRQALLSNYSTSETNVREDVRTVRELLRQGGDEATIRRDLRTSAPAARDLVAVAGLPDDLVDELVRRGSRIDNAAEIAMAARRFELDDETVRDMFSRYVAGAQANVTRTALRERIEMAAPLYQEQLFKRSGGFESLNPEWQNLQKDSMLGMVDSIVDKKAEIQRQIDRAGAARKFIKEFQRDPEATDIVLRSIDNRIEELRIELRGFETDFESRKRAIFEGRDGGPGRTGPNADAFGRGSGRGDRDGAGSVGGTGAGEAAVQQQSGPGLFDDFFASQDAGASSPVQPAVVGQSPAAAPQAAAAAQPTGPVTPGKPPAVIPPGRPPQAQKVSAQGKPRKDLFNTVPRGQRLAEEQAFSASARGRIDAALRAIGAKAGGEGLDPNLRRAGDAAPFTIKEKNRIENLIASYEGNADELWGAVEDSGIKLDLDSQGNFRLANGASFEDMIEQSTPAGQRAYAALTSKQRAAVDALKGWNDQLNANLRFHGDKNLPWDNFNTLYFPRVVKTIDGKTRAFAGPGGKRLGAKQSFEQSRTFATFEEGANANVNYANPREAFRMMTRAKLRAAQDDYLARSLKPLGVTQKNLPKGARIGFDYIMIPRDVAPGLSGTYFKVDDAKRITAALAGKAAFDVAPVRAANAILTPFRATADVSAFGQQGAALFFRHPGKAAKAMVNVIRSVGDDAVYRRMIQEEAKRGPGLQPLIERMGLHWVPGELEKLDEGAVRAFNIPGLKQVSSFSNKTFGRYMNYVRLVFANDAWERIQKSGKTGAELRKDLMGAGNAVNRMSGFTGRKPTSLENLSLFAPRYFSASVEQLAAAVSRGGIEGSLARGHMFRMVAGAAAVAYVWNKANGHDTDFDPRSNNFLRLRNVGGLDVSLMGTYDTLFRAIAGTAAGDANNPGPDVKRLWRLAEGKMSPALQVVYYPFVKGATYSGEPLDPTSAKGAGKVLYEQGKASLPFGLQNIVSEGIEPAVSERDPGKLLEVLPGTLASGVGLSNNPVTPTESRNWRRDAVAKERFGAPYDELTGAQKSMVNEDAKVKRTQAEADRNTLTREDDRSKNEKARLDYDRKIEALTQRFEAGQVSGSEFRQQYNDLQNQLRGARSVLKQAERDDEVSGWFDLYDEAQRADGSTDHDLLEELQTAYAAEHPGIEAKVDQVTGTRDNAVMRQFRVAKGQAAEYYALPAYNGLNVEQGERARTALNFARRLTGAGQAGSLRQALWMLNQAGMVPTEDIALALAASRLGTSIERKQYVAAHPEFAAFYRDAFPVDDIFPEAGTQSAARRAGGRGSRLTSARVTSQASSRAS